MNKIPLIVASKSNPNSVAGMLTQEMKEYDDTEIRVVGAGALNQAIKAVAIARGYLAPLGIDLCIIPTFAEITINDDTRTCIKLIIKKI